MLLSPAGSQFQCLDNEYMCRRIDACVPWTSVCDGISDCTDGSDEDEVACPHTAATIATTTATSTGEGFSAIKLVLFLGPVSSVRQ